MQSGSEIDCELATTGMKARLLDVKVQNGLGLSYPQKKLNKQTNTPPENQLSGGDGAIASNMNSIRINHFDFVNFVLIFI